MSVKAICADCEKVFDSVEEVLRHKEREHKKREALREYDNSHVAYERVKDAKKN